MNKVTALLLVVALAITGQAFARVADNFQSMAFTLGLGTTLPPVTVTQDYSAAVIGGQRRVTLVKNTGTADSPTVSGITSSGGSLEYAAGAGETGEVTLIYGATVDMNEEFAGNSSLTGFVIEGYSGSTDGNPGQFITAEITLTTDGASDTASAQLTATGDYYIPWTAFPSVNPHNIDRIEVHFIQDANAPAGVFAIGTIGSGSDTGPVATEPSTWSTVKALFE